MVIILYKYLADKLAVVTLMHVMLRLATVYPFVLLSYAVPFFVS